jgi:hypothetical protein
MRNRMMIGTAALLVASATLAGAQEKPQDTTPSSGQIDIGGRFTSTTGDEARYERYRDLRDGVNANFLYGKETKDWAVDFLAKNIGYRDGRYVLGFSNSRIKLNAYFDQIPLNYAYYARTPYSCTAGSCTLNADLRTQVQNGQASPRPSASWPRARSTTRSPGRSTCGRAGTRSAPTCASARPTTWTCSSG